METETKAILEFIESKMLSENNGEQYLKLFYAFWSASEADGNPHYTAETLEKFKRYLLITADSSTSEFRLQDFGGSRPQLTPLGLTFARYLMKGYGN